MERAVDIGAGVGDHVDPADLEGRAVIVIGRRRLARPKVADMRPGQALVGGHALLDHVAEVDEPFRVAILHRAANPIPAQMTFNAADGHGAVPARIEDEARRADHIHPLIGAVLARSACPPTAARRRPGSAAPPPSRSTSIASSSMVIRPSSCRRPALTGTPSSSASSISRALTPTRSCGGSLKRRPVGENSAGLAAVVGEICLLEIGAHVGIELAFDGELLGGEIDAAKAGLGAQAAIALGDRVRRARQGDPSPGRNGRRPPGLAQRRSSRTPAKHRRREDQGGGKSKDGPDRMKPGPSIEQWNGGVSPRRFRASLSDPC